MCWAYITCVVSDFSSHSKSKGGIQFIFKKSRNPDSTEPSESHPSVGALFRERTEGDYRRWSPILRPRRKNITRKEFPFFQKAFPVKDQHFTTKSSMAAYPRRSLPRRKDHSTETRHSESSTLGHRTLDRGITDLNYSPSGREFTVATDLSCRS